MVVQAVADLTGPRLAVVGCGNPNRSDDGAGSRVIARLRAQGPAPPGVAFHDAGTDGMGVLYLARGARRLVIVDASAPRGSPGAVYEPPEAMLVAPPPHGLNLHDFRWDHALFVGRRIFGEDFPDDVRVYLIEAGNLALGLQLSAPVERAVAVVTDRIMARARTLAAEPPP